MADRVYVSVTEGKIQGIKKISNFSSTEYYSFFGIPYAQPPVGNARFKDPVKIKPWNTILNATIEKQGCRQFCILTRRLKGSEDCLYNNIHTLKLPEKDDPLKPVIVNIHPGAFVYGSPEPSIFGSPEFVIHNDFVYVCVSFRLHILGFLNLGLKECSGNQALKDIIMSLEWIKVNISAFGGDPNNVTLMGSSSGAAIVHALLLSPRVTGLFHKAVLMGMYSMNPSLVTHHEHVTIAFEIAESLGYVGTADNKRKLLSFYKKVPVDAIISLRPLMCFDKDKVPMFPAPPFLPTSDPGENSILPLPIDQLVASTERIPIMVGFCENESAMAFFSALKSRLEKNFYSILTQNIWGWGKSLNEEDLNLIQKEAELFYLNGESTKNATMSDKSKIQTDIALSDVYGSLINIIAKDLPSSVFVYKFNFEGSIPTFKKSIAAQMDKPLNGTIHGDDYSYWSFILNLWREPDYKITSKTREMVEIFTKLIYTFAEKGDPNYDGLEVQWEPSSIENPHYLNIEDSLTLIKGTIHADDYSYWALVKDYQKYDGYVLTPSTCAMIEKFTKLLTTFAKTGNPNYEGLNVEWKPTTKTNPCYLRIDEELELIDEKLNGKRMEFWEGLKKEFAKN